MGKNKIAIIEPAPLLVSGIKSLLEDSIEYEIAFVFNTLQGYEIRAQHIQVDIVIVSPQLFDYNTRCSIRNVLTLSEGTALVGLTSAYVDEKTFKQFDAVIDIFDDIQSIAQKLQTALRQHTDSTESPDNYNLSDREKEILVAVAKGLTNKEIADAHLISVNTVITHRKNIAKKTGIKSVSGLTVYALLNNLISQSDVE